MLENVEFFHIEFGINAGLPFASCMCIQQGNITSKSAAMTSKHIFAGCLMLNKSPVSILLIFSTRTQDTNPFLDMHLREDV
jgi:hypothetical protein